MFSPNRTKTVRITFVFVYSCRVTVLSAVAEIENKTMAVLRFLCQVQIQGLTLDLKTIRKPKRHLILESSSDKNGQTEKAVAYFKEAIKYDP